MTIDPVRIDNTRNCPDCEVTWESAALCWICGRVGLVGVNRKEIGGSLRMYAKAEHFAGELDSTGMKLRETA